MIEILVVILFLLAFFAALIVLPILVVIKVARSLFEPAINEVAGAVNEARDHNWRNADAVERERMVRNACGWRVIGRVVGAGGNGRWRIHRSLTRTRIRVLSGGLANTETN